ncbi:MAG: gfo/Idh/MocA family oxidoreductase, partial [Gemmatimonadetes bacterium]
MTKTPRIGVVGAGSLGFHHIRILRDLRTIHFSGFAETKPERRKEVEKELRVRSHSTLDALLDESDAVVIVVPTSAHFS